MATKYKSNDKNMNEINKILTKDNYLIKIDYALKSY